MKPIKLSKRQKEVYEKLCDNPGGFIRRHVRPNNNVCWRVLDSNLSPLLNVTDFVVEGLVQKGVLQLDKSKQNYILIADTDRVPTMDISNLGLVKS